MRKFLTVSVCLFASLMANASISVTKCADGATDSIRIDGSFTEAEIQNLKITSSSVKLATGSYELTQEQWDKFCDKVVTAKNIYTLDMSDARFGYDLGNALGDSFGGKLTNWGQNKIKNVTMSRYTNIPDNCFNFGNQIETVTIPDKKYESESITIGEKAFNGMENLKTLYIGSCVEGINESMCTGCKTLNKVTFNTPTITELPYATFQKCESLKQIDLPTNLQIVGMQAFENCGLETISFPNTLTTIKVNAFNSCKLEYVVIPEKVTLIESGAFKGNTYLTDVYVMGEDVRCEVNGFSNLQTCSDFTNENKGQSEANPSSREDWVGTGMYATPIVLHFATKKGNESETFQHYENPYWIMLNTYDILNEVKACDTDDKRNAFIKKYGLHKEFPWSLYNYANGTGSCPFAYYKYKSDNGEEKICKIWRKEVGYYSDDKKENIEKLGDDAAYMGWKQFLIIQDDVKQNIFDDIKRIDDRWYSMCFPFDLTANQIRTAYGAGTEVCEFIGAWDTKRTNANGDKIINFRFKPLLEEKSNEALNEEEENADARGISPIITKANKAYMIHPASKKEGDNTNVWHRIIPGIPAEQQIGHQEQLIATIPEEHVEEIMDKCGIEEDNMLRGYQFLGNYDSSVLLPSNCYYFAYKDYADGSRILILNNLTEANGYKWTPMTALVKYTGSDSSAAKCFSAFSFETNTEKGATTGIEDINTNRLPSSQLSKSQKIYNMNGQVVKEGTSLEGLGKGIYVMNGKKFIVK